MVELLIVSEVKRKIENSHRAAIRCSLERCLTARAGRTGCKQILGVTVSSSVDGSVGDFRMYTWARGANICKSPKLKPERERTLPRVLHTFDTPLLTFVVRAPLYLCTHNTVAADLSLVLCLSRSKYVSAGYIGSVVGNLRRIVFPSSGHKCGHAQTHDLRIPNEPDNTLCKLDRPPRVHENPTEITGDRGILFFWPQSSFRRGCVVGGMYHLWTLRPFPLNHFRVVHLRTNWK